MATSTLEPISFLEEILPREKGKSEDDSQVLNLKCDPRNGRIVYCHVTQYAFSNEWGNMKINYEWWVEWINECQFLTQTVTRKYNVHGLILKIGSELKTILEAMAKSALLTEVFSYSIVYLNESSVSFQSNSNKQCIESNRCPLWGTSNVPWRLTWS